MEGTFASDGVRLVFVDNPPWTGRMEDDVDYSFWEGQVVDDVEL